MCKYYLESLQEETVGSDLASWIEHSIAAQFSFRFSKRYALKQRSVLPPMTGKILLVLVVPYRASEWLDHTTPSVVSADFQMMVSETFDKHSFSSQAIALYTHTLQGFSILESKGYKDFFFFFLSVQHPIRFLYFFIAVRFFYKLTDPLQ